MLYRLGQTLTAAALLLLLPEATAIGIIIALYVVFGGAND